MKQRTKIAKHRLKFKAEKTGLPRDRSASLKRRNKRRKANNTASHSRRKNR